MQGERIFHRRDLLPAFRKTERTESIVEPWPLFASAKWNHKDRLLGEGEKKKIAFLLRQGKEATAG